MDSLTARCLISTRAGSPTRAAAYLLNFPNTVSFSVASKQGHQSQLDLSEVASLQGHTATPPASDVALFQGHPFEPVHTLDIDSSIPNVIDRVLTAHPSKFEQADLQDVRSWLMSWQSKSGPTLHPPDLLIAAQMLAIAPKDRIIRLVQDLSAENRKCGETWGWWPVVALQRVHGINWRQVQARRAQLRVVKGNKRAPNDAELTALIQEVAKRKAL